MDMCAKLSRKSLVDLNLRGNGLIEVRNVQCLPELEHLNLGMS